VDSQQPFLTAELEMEYLNLKLSRIVRWTELVLGAGLLKLESIHDQKILHVPAFRDTRIGVGGGRPGWTFPWSPLLAGPIHKPAPEEYVFCTV
jgi:hypothetical protein